MPCAPSFCRISCFSSQSNLGLSANFSLVLLRVDLRPESMVVVAFVFVLVFVVFVLVLVFVLFLAFVFLYGVIGLRTYSITFDRAHL